MSDVTRPASQSLAPIYASAIRVLNVGFRISAALLVIGLAIAAAKQESLKEQVDSFGDVIPEILDGNASGVIDLAILAMMCTPLVTVVVVAAGFFRLGDRRYGTLSLVVLAVLGVSVTLSLLR
jgi:hypothetical protein